MKLAVEGSNGNSMDSQKRVKRWGNLGNGRKRGRRSQAIGLTIMEGSHQKQSNLFGDEDLLEVPNSMMVNGTT